MALVVLLVCIATIVNDNCFLPFVFPFVAALIFSTLQSYLVVDLFKCLCLLVTLELGEPADDPASRAVRRVALARPSTSRRA